MILDGRRLESDVPDGMSKVVAAFWIRHSEGRRDEACITSENPVLDNRAGYTPLATGE
jgi:hypothetical protein